jgi:hypothetical protein
VSEKSHLPAIYQAEMFLQGLKRLGDFKTNQQPAVWNGISVPRPVSPGVNSEVYLKTMISIQLQRQGHVRLQEVQTHLDQHNFLNHDTGYNFIQFSSSPVFQYSMSEPE